MREFVSNYRRRHRAMQRNLLEMENDKRAEHIWLISIGFRAVKQFETSFFLILWIYFSSLAPKFAIDVAIWGRHY